MFLAALTKRKKVTTQNITAKQALNVLETKPGFSPKEREKGLAISIYYYLVENPSNRSIFVEAEVLWSFSKFIIKENLGQDIREFDLNFFSDVNSYPSNYLDYK